MTSLSTHYQQDENRIWMAGERQNFGYNDGDEVEERIYRQVCATKDVSLASDELKAQITDWPTQYHYTSIRANLLQSFALERFQRVLEIGSGCGAISRQLGEMGLEVTSLEGSYRRATITRERCRDLKNVEVCCEGFQNFQSEGKFDLITLIGVLEYAPLFFSGENPLQQALEKAYSLLEEGGTLIIAIENQLGLKYFNGCAEDHVPRMFFGLNNLYHSGTARTLGRAQLRELLQGANFQEQDFYYPFPDYKLPRLLITESAWDQPLPLVELVGQYPAQDYSGFNDRFTQESEIWPTLIKNGLGRDLANSFLVFAHKGQAKNPPQQGDWLFQTFSGARRREFLSRNRVSPGEQGLTLDKQGLSLDKQAQYPNSPPQENRITQHLGKEDFISGSPYGSRLPQLLWSTDSLDALKEYYLPWLRQLQEKASGKKLPGKELDFLPLNLIRTPEGELLPFDQEWEWHQELDLEFMIFRAVLHDLDRNRYWLKSSPLFTKTAPLALIRSLCEEVGGSLEEQALAPYIALEQEIQIACGGPIFEQERLYQEILELLGRPQTPEPRADEMLTDYRQKAWQVEHHQLQLAGMEQSLSWRLGRLLTAPLRSLKTLLRPQ